MSSPDSAKTIAQMPSSPKASIRCLGVEEVREQGEHPARVLTATPAGQISAGWLNRLVPLRPADPGSPVGGLEAAQRPGEAGVAGAVGCLVDQVDGAEVARLDRELERPAGDLTAGGEPVVAELLAGRAHVDLLDATIGRQHVAGREAVHARHTDPRGVEARAVLEAPGGPHPAEVPPVAHAPAVVALADAVELDRLVADEDLAVHVARHLVAGGADPRVQPAAVGLPLEVEAEGHAIAAKVAVDLGGIVDGDRERLAAERHVVEGRLDDVVGPQAVGADLERRRLGQRHLVVDHGDERSSLPHQAGPVPGHAEVRVQPEPHVAAERALSIGEVEVPRLAPEPLLAGWVGELVGVGELDGGRVLAHASASSG